MPSLVDNIAEVKNLVVTEVPAGSRATLECNSNDYNHNFMFWILDKNTVIGPGNTYDERKYKYEVLSGKLHIDVSICKYSIMILFISIITFIIAIIT